MSRLQNGKMEGNNRPLTMRDLNAFINRTSEEKYKDVSSSYTVVDYNGALWDLTPISQGTADTERIGDSLAPMKLELRGQVHGADSSNDMRIILFRWHSDTADVAPTPSKILQSTFTSTDLAPYAPYYHDKRDLSTILWDKRICVEGSTSSSNYSVDFECKLPIRGKNVRFTANSYDGTYKIYLLVISDSGAVSHPAVTFVNRLFFRDA